MAAAWILSCLIHDCLLLACSTAICELMGQMLSAAVIFMIMGSSLQSMKGSSHSIHLTGAFTFTQTQSSHTDVSSVSLKEAKLTVPTESAYLYCCHNWLIKTNPPKRSNISNHTITSLTGAGRCCFCPTLQGIQLGNITLWVPSAQTPLITAVETR